MYTTIKQVIKLITTKLLIKLFYKDKTENVNNLEFQTLHYWNLNLLPVCTMCNVVFSSQSSVKTYLTYIRQNLPGTENIELEPQRQWNWVSLKGQLHWQ